MSLEVIIATRSGAMHSPSDTRARDGKRVYQLY